MNTRKTVAVLAATLLVALAFSACPSPDTGGGSPPFMEMVQIPAGTFTMGSSDSQDLNASPSHDVTLSAFSMGKYEVTQAQYQEVMGSLPSLPSSSSFAGVGDNYPVHQVSWYQAIVFCNRLSMKERLTPAYRINGSTDPSGWGTVPTSSNATWNAVEIVAGSTGYRLPTEAQWEYACRAGTTTPWHTASGTNSDLGAYAWYSPNGSNTTHEVGSKFANAFRLYDMHGNVSEWCWDWYAAYSNSSDAQTDPGGAASGTNRVVRGGNFSETERFARSACRSWNTPYFKNAQVGFRLVRPQLGTGG